MKLKVASPCEESWDRMRGDERVRHCERCSLHVYNLSALTKAEAEDLIRGTEGRLCARFYQRKDGTVMTRDCPEGFRRKLRFAFTGAGVAALLLAILACLSIGRGGGGGCSNVPRWLHTAMEWFGHEHPVIVGSVCPVTPPPSNAPSNP